MLLGITEDWDSVAVELALFRRDGVGWKQQGDGWPAVLGRGSAWGRGLHGDGVPAGQSGTRKQEGDGRSPAGVFALGPTYGYWDGVLPRKDNADAPARLPYTQLVPGWECVDDPASAHYNRVLDGRTVKRDWRSSEIMRRKDDLYRWVVEVGHNGGGGTGEPRPGAGSCIFLHVWRAADAPTVGCTAMDAVRIESLIARVQPEDAPVYVLLPRASYLAMREAWRLP